MTAAVKLTEALVVTLREHLPRDRYDPDGLSVGTYCTCGNWEGGYFADGDAGPFDDHLAAMLGPVVAARVAAALGEVEAVHEAYFDLDYEPGWGESNPEPEDVWRYDRDLRAVLARVREVRGEVGG